MYGSGGYSHPAIAPRQGQAGYSQARNSGEKYYAPEIDKGPNMRGVLKGDQNSQYAHLNDIDEEDEEKMLIPKQVTPHNVPWESTYKKIETVD
jgi:hypothetical protein